MCIDKVRIGTGRRGPAGVKRPAEAVLPGVPGLWPPIEDVVAEGDQVRVRLPVQGTHDGELMGVPATGRLIDIAVLDLFTTRDAQLVGHRALLDNLGLLRQIGITSI